MLETLYKTRTPEASVLDGECYELILDAEPANGRVGSREVHPTTAQPRQERVLALVFPALLRGKAIRIRAH